MNPPENRGFWCVPLPILIAGHKFTKKRLTGAREKLTHNLDALTAAGIRDSRPNHRRL
jgi:hypothetical protein